MTTPRNLERLQPRTTATSADMPLVELLRPLSAKALPSSAMTGKHGDDITEAEARARALICHKRNAKGRRTGGIA